MRQHSHGRGGWRPKGLSRSPLPPPLPATVSCHAHGRQKTLWRRWSALLKDFAMDLKKFSSNSGARTRAGKKHLTRKPPTYWKASGHLCRHLCIRVRNLFQESFEKDRAFAIQYAPDMWVHQPSAVGFGFFQVGAHGHELLGK